ncbi:MAG: F0F1 ATP synthase subunit epsilon, partial [Alphaproteobacteria bacterium]|nr:F0F1 ATP synthase subunit epsilon [Alphaproteobacteria bacterium]
MNLTVLTPLGIVLQTKVQKVILETLNGYHTFLPKHIDFVSALGPNIVAYWNDEN